MVTMPPHGCVGSGLIANENRGSGVLLGRLLYSTTVGCLFPTVRKANDASCINEQVNNLCLICKSADKMLSGQHTEKSLS